MNVLHETTIEDFLAANPEYARIKPTTLETLRDYVLHGWHPGDFLSAVLRNDLFVATGRADHENSRDLVEIVRLVYNEMPGDCHNLHGNRPDAVRQWWEGRRAELALHTEAANE